MTPRPMEWIAISYTVPAKPSRARVYVWRHLRALHAESVNPGLSILPDNDENRRAFAKIAGEVRSFGGEAVLAQFEFIDKRDEDAVKSRFAAAAKEEEQALLKRFEMLSDRLSTAEGGAKSAAVRELKQTIDRFGKSPLRAFSNNDAEGELARAADEMFGTLRSLSGELTSLFRTFKNNAPPARRNEDV